MSKKPGSRPTTNKEPFYKKTIFLVAAIIAFVSIIFFILIKSNLDNSRLMREKVEKYNKTAKESRELLKKSGEIIGINAVEIASRIRREKNISKEQMQALFDNNNKDGGMYLLCFESILETDAEYPDEVNSKTNMSEIDTYQKRIDRTISKLNDVNENTCKELYEEKINKIADDYLKQEAEKQAKNAKEAEEQQKWEASRLSLDKFNNQIRTGMSLAAIKKIFAFDSKCELSSESSIAGYHSQMYTCKDASGVATFLFQNNILQSKSQFGL